MKYWFSEMYHKYGDNVHILADFHLLSLLARLGRKEAVQPEISQLISSIYSFLTSIVLNNEFPII